MAEKPSREKTIANLYAEFYKHDQKGEHERALKTINKIFSMSQDDETAFHCKIVCLIHLNRFDEALQHMERQSKLSGNLHFEQAYCLYRTNCPEKGLKVLESVQENEVTHRMLELRAQILYRTEKYAESMDIYTQMFRSIAPDDYEEERLTNLAAVGSFRPNDAQDIIPMMKEETYEMCFNKALMFANMEHYSDAESLLKKAEKLLKESFDEDGATEDEMEAELAHIQILMAYCYQRQGRIKESQQMYVSALRANIDDNCLIAVASNNAVVNNKDQNVFDSKKKMKAATNDLLITKLPSDRRSIIALNNSIFNYYIHQHEQSNKLCMAVGEEWPEYKTKAKILNALNIMKIKSKANPIDILNSFEPENEEERIYTKMTCVQLLLMQGEKLKACEILETLGDYSYKPGVVGALITLYVSLSKEDVATEIYRKATEHYISHEKSGDLIKVFKQAAEYHIQSGRPDVAAKSLEQLLQRDPKDFKTIAQLILAYSQFNEKKAIEFDHKLGPISDIEKDVDIENVESTAWLTAKRGATVKSTDVSPGPTEASRKRKHKKKPGKLPKDYQANATPDPERWLPKHERTGFRKKRDRRMKDIIKGSQGTTAGQTDQFDYSKMVSEHEDSPVSVEPSPMQKGNRQKKGGNQKKKNKRR